MKQTGLITVAPRWTDYKMQGETTLKKVVLNAERDWKKYTSRAERQYVPGFDTLSCVTFSALNDLEMIGNLKVEKKLYTEENIKWLKDNGYFDDDGRLNFSDRFIAILSGTTMLGNDVVSVGNAIIKYGLIPEQDLPLAGNSWAEYMDPNKISPAMLAKGKEFRARFLPGYEWVWFSNDAVFDDNEVKALQEALQYAPVQIGIPSPSTHATSMIAIQPVTSYDVFDHYEPFFFHTAWNSGGVHWAFRYSFDEVPVAVPPTYPVFEFTRDLEYRSHITNPALKPDIVMWQRVLIAEGFLKAGLDDGIFLNLTVAATKQFQTKYGISPVGRVGPVTRKKANELTSAKKKLLVTSEAGIKLIKAFEGLHDGNTSTPILEPKQDPAGYPTIGWGTRYDKNGNEVTMQTQPITLEEAEQLLKRDLLKFESTVNTVIKIDLNQAQFDALVSLCYNIGSGAFSGSRIAVAINKGLVKPYHFFDYVNAKGIKLDGLVQRRFEECLLYFGV